MTAICEGRLKLTKQYAYDGVTFFHVLSPTLTRLMYRNKKDNSVIGEWRSIGNVIVSFKKGEICLRGAIRS